MSTTPINGSLRPAILPGELAQRADEGRQTPVRPSFGAVLAAGVQTALIAGSRILGGGVPAGIAVAASLSGGGSVPSGAAGGPSGSASGMTSPTSGQSPEQQLLAEQESLRARDRVFNLQYLELQRKTQEDGRVFQVATNLMKAQHETVKTAINNLR